MPNESQILNHYKKKIRNGNYQLLQKYDKEYLNVYNTFIKIIKSNLSNENKSMQNTSLLDIGCFTGDFLVLAQNEGCAVTGYEIQEEAIKIANDKLPGRVHKVDVYNDQIKKEQFDIVTIFGLLEHVLEPIELLKRIKLLLRKDGYLFIQTPNSGSLVSLLFGKRWPPISPIEHIHLFSKRFLTSWADDNGYQVIDTYRHWKFLPIEYVYSNLSNFGPDIKKFINPIYKFLPNFIKIRTLPFYGGEMIVVLKNK